MEHEPVVGPLDRPPFGDGSETPGPGLDTLGLLLAVLVTAASVQDSVAGTSLLDQVAAEHPRIRKVWVDGGYRRHLVEHAATLGLRVVISMSMVTMLRFLPTIFFPASTPWPAAGTLVEVLTL